MNEPRISFKDSLLPPLFFIALLWIIHAFQVLTHFDLGYWGIYPRESFGLRGILFAPLLHGDWAHLISNSLPFLVLATIVIYFYTRVALPTFIILYFVSGIAVWLFARPSVFHIGLSYVIYGLVSFVFWTGVFRRSIRSIVLALIVTTLYSGMILGILPTEEIISKNISWESHLFGAIVGIITAYFFKEDLEEDEHHPTIFKKHAIDESAQTYFFEPDIFEKTKVQRAEEEALERRLREEFYRQQAQNNTPQWGDDWTTNSTG